MQIEYFPTASSDPTAVRGYSVSPVITGRRLRPPWATRNAGNVYRTNKRVQHVHIELIGPTRETRICVPYREYLILVVRRRKLREAVWNEFMSGVRIFIVDFRVLKDAENYVLLDLVDSQLRTVFDMGRRDPR